MIPHHPPAGVLTAIAREVEHRPGVDAGIDLRDPKVQDEVAELAFNANAGTHGGSLDDYRTWTGVLFTSLADYLEALT